MARGQQRKMPNVGDMIEHVLPHLETERRGVVVYHLMDKFVYETEDGATCICNLRNEPWFLLKKAPPKAARKRIPTGPKRRRLKTSNRKRLK